MDVIVVLEERFLQTSGGEAWTNSPFDLQFWHRYLDVFDRVRVVARACRIASPPAGSKRCDDDRVSFAAVPNYVGPWQYLARAASVRRAVLGAIGPGDAVVLRVASQLASVMIPSLLRSGHPYGVQVVCDPFEVFAPGSAVYSFRPFFRWWLTRQLRRQCAGASAASYVTERALQSRYPTGRGAYSTHFSDVILPRTAFAPSPKPCRPSSRLRVITVGSMDQMYKGTDVLIDAIANCVRYGLDLELVVAGEGRHRPELEARARSLGLADRVHFLGHLPSGEAVRQELDRADLFALPSRTEGLPRAMIEAMARALPCVGTAVGGIPELLRPEDLVSPGDADGLARKIRELASEPDRMARMSTRNLNKAMEYEEGVLHRRRVAFYSHLRSVTEEWVRAKGVGIEHIRQPAT